MDVERTIEFIIEQQAKFSADMDEARKRQDRFDEQLAALGRQLAETITQQSQINMALGKSMLGLTEHIEQLRAAQAITDERMRATDDRLNALIGVVDGFIRRPPTG